MKKIIALSSLAGLLATSVCFADTTATTLSTLNSVITTQQIKEMPKKERKEYFHSLTKEQKKALHQQRKEMKKENGERHRHKKHKKGNS